MSDLIYTPDQIKLFLEPVFRKHGVRYAVLFGSYAKGVQTDASDIDIMVDSGLKGLSFFALLNDVSEAIKKDVDLLDVSQIQPGSIIDFETQKTGVQIYGECSWI